MVSDGRTRHAPALVRTGLAGIGTTLTVLGIVLATFGATSFTDFCTDPTDVLHKPRVAAHEGGCGPADLRAISIQPDAFRHFRDSVLVQARVGAVFALLGTTDAGLDTGLKFLVTHSTVTPIWGEWERGGANTARERKSGAVKAGVTSPY
jgi:hypothetical protein